MPRWAQKKSISLPYRPGRGDERAWCRPEIARNIIANIKKKFIIRQLTMFTQNCCWFCDFYRRSPYLSRSLSLPLLLSSYASHTYWHLSVRFTLFSRCLSAKWNHRVEDRDPPYPRHRLTRKQQKCLLVEIFFPRNGICRKNMKKKTDPIRCFDEFSECYFVRVVKCRLDH